MSSKKDLTVGGLCSWLAIACLPFLVFLGVRIYCGITYNITIEGHLKRAADANTIQLAKQEMAAAIAAIESQGLTTGYTSVIYRTPDEDVGFWYENLKAARDELASVPVNATPLEKSNLLMKLRETILDDGKEISITSPAGISLYPNNAVYLLFGWLSAGWLCFLFIVMAIRYG